MQYPQSGLLPRNISTCMFFSYICMRFCMRVFVIHLYACLFHTFLHLYLVWPWRSGECGRPITRGLAVQSPLTAQQKNYQCSTHSQDSSPETFLLACFCHTFECVFFSYICMRVCMRVFVIHLYAILYACFFHTFVCMCFFHTFVCGLLSYICMRFCMHVFFIHL